MGLWDSVPALGPVIGNDIAESKAKEMNLQVSDRFKTVAHAVASNEHRDVFMVRSIYGSASTAELKDGKAIGGKTRIERGFMGSHSDIGGGYSEGDLSDVALTWMIDQAKKTGVKFDDKLIDTRKYNEVSNPIVHDSVGTLHAGQRVAGEDIGLVLMPPGRDFAWANDNNKTNSVNQHLTGMAGQVLAGSMQGYNTPADESKTTVNHLKLNWNDTLQFQNASYDPAKKDGKFEKTLTLEQAYSNTLTCNPLAVTRCQPLEDYYGLKTGGLDKDGAVSKDQTVLYSTDPEKAEMIQTQKYLDWVKANYLTSLTFNLDPRLQPK